MDKFKLKLNYGFREANSISLELLEKSDWAPGIELDIDAGRYVLSDYSYTAELEGLDLDAIDCLEFLVNDFPIQHTITNGKIIFCDQRYPRGMIFMDNFGYVQIGIYFEHDGRKIELTTKYITVLVKKGIVSESVQRMAQFVYLHHEPFLRGGRMSSCCNKGVKEDSPQILSSKIKILHQILEQYEKNLGFFRNGSKFQVKLEGNFVDFEHAQYIDNESIRSIVQNPTYLKPITHQTCIEYMGSNYIPTKVYSKTSKVSYDIYENRVVVGFLKTLQDEVAMLIGEISVRIERIPSEKEVVSGYFSSAGFIYDVTKQQLQDYQRQLENAQKKITDLYLLYSSVLHIPGEHIDAVPAPTTIFLSIHHYRTIYEGIVAWYRYGIYDFAREDFMLPFIQMHKLYECYVLLKLCCYWESEGFVLKQREYYSYERHLASDTAESYNTFHFTKDDQAVTVYYEPIIRGGDKPRENGIGLFRNTSIPIPKQWQIEQFLSNGNSRLPKGRYYCPDYLVKRERGSKAEYIILDAKFSGIDTVKSVYLPSLSYKYLFSLSTFENTDRVVGMCIVNGKSEKAADEIYDIYDLAPVSKRIDPFAVALTLTENTGNDADHHLNLLSSIFNSAM